MPPNAPSPTPTGETPPPVGTRRRVLIVDDEPDTTESMAMLLRASGYDARTAYDGPAALAAALDYRPDVVLLDIGLPIMNGFEVARQLRAQAAFQDVALVAVTGYDREQDRQRTKDAGFDYHLVKPAPFSEVQKILTAVAERRRA